MRFSRGLVWVFTTCLLSGALAFAQGDQSSGLLYATATVPRLIRIRGAVQDENWESAQRCDRHHVRVVRR